MNSGDCVNARSGSKSILTHCVLESVAGDVDIVGKEQAITDKMPTSSILFKI